MIDHSLFLGSSPCGTTSSHHVKEPELFEPELFHLRESNLRWMFLES